MAEFTDFGGMKPLHESVNDLNEKVARLEARVAATQAENIKLTKDIGEVKMAAYYLAESVLDVTLFAQKLGAGDNIGANITLNEIVDRAEKILKHLGRK